MAFSLDDQGVDVDWLYHPDQRTSWTIVPGLVGVIVMIGMLMLGALSLVRERERGTWETLLATPVGALDALVGKRLPHLVVGAAQGALVVALARVMFDLPVTGGIGALLVALPLFAAAHLILGFAVSALAESQLQAMQGAVFFYLPSMLLSGFMFPFQGMPGWAASDRRSAAADPFRPRDPRRAPEGRRGRTCRTRDVGRWRSLPLPPPPSR